MAHRHRIVTSMPSAMDERLVEMSDRRAITPNDMIRHIIDTVIAIDDAREGTDEVLLLGRIDGMG